MAEGDLSSGTAKSAKRWQITVYGDGCFGNNQPQFSREAIHLRRTKISAEEYSVIYKHKIWNTWVWNVSELTMVSTGGGYDYDELA